MLKPDYNSMYDINKAIEACRLLIRSLSDPNTQPLEREAGYLLAKALRVQVESMDLGDNPTVQQLIRLENQRPATHIRRFPQDFINPEE